MPHGGRGGHNWHSYLCVPAGSLSSRQSESWQRERQAFPIPHPSLFFFPFAACDEKKARCVRVCVCVCERERERESVCVCMCVCVFWISVLLHNKSLLNKCKADGTVVSPPCGGKEREEGEREKEKEREKNTRLLLILILHRHTDHAHYTDGDCVELQKHLILEWKLKVVSEYWRTPKHILFMRENILFIRRDCRRACWY